MNVAKTIAATSTSILNQQSLRASIALVNSGLLDVWVSKGSTAAVGSGILLKADGGSYTEGRNSLDEPLYTGPYSAIAVSGTANMGVTEDYYDFI